MGHMQNLNVKAWSDPRELLEQFADMPLKRFMINRRVQLAGAEDALWNVIYPNDWTGDADDVDAIIKQCENSKHTVREVLDGAWKPKGLES